MRFPVAPTSRAIQQFREAHNLSQEALAELLGIERRTVQRWERKDRSPPALLSLALRELERELA